LHLFKEDWLSINQYLTTKFEQGEKPTAYLRKGDTEDYIKLFQDNGCEIKYHKYGYRSVHYLLKSNLDKETITSEVQVRTIFEEAWSEIDHTVRYPNNLDNIILEQFLVIFNRLAGSSDEMGSYVMYLKNELDKFSDNYAKYEKTISDNNKLIEQLRDKIKTLELKDKDLITINSNLDTIRQSWQNIAIPKLEGLKGLESASLNFQNFLEPLKGNIELMKNSTLDFNKTFVKAVKPLSGVVLQSSLELNQPRVIKTTQVLPKAAMTNPIITPTNQKEKELNKPEIVEKMKKKEKKKHKKKKSKNKRKD